MKTFCNPRFLAILSLFALAACDQTENPAAPEFDELLSFDEEIELSILADPAATESALMLVATNADVASRRGDGRADRARPHADRARVRFDNARDALARGDRRVALDEARQARRLVAEGIREAGGVSAVDAMVQKVEAMALTVTESPDDYVAPAALAADLNTLAFEARRAMDRGDVAGAGERAILGDQRARRDRGQDGRRGHVTVDRAEVAVAMAGHAIALADRLIGNAPTDEQNRFLETANEFLSKAREALDEGHYSRAAHFAQLATWHALKAVILPDEVQEEEVREIVEVAEELLAEARAAVGDAPTDVETKLLERAGRLLELAQAKLAEGQLRGVGAAWQSAVISSYLIG